MSWYDRACEQIDKDYSEGLLTGTEYRIAMRELNQEYDECARDAAKDTYDSFY